MWKSLPRPASGLTLFSNARVTATGWTRVNAVSRSQFSSHRDDSLRPSLAFQLGANWFGCSTLRSVRTHNTSHPLETASKSRSHGILSVTLCETHSRVEPEAAQLMKSWSSPCSSFAFLSTHVYHQLSYCCFQKNWNPIIKKVENWVTAEIFKYLKFCKIW